MRPIRALLVASLLLLAACGQKPGIQNLAGGELPAGATMNERGQIVDAQGNVIGSASDLSDGVGVASGDGNTSSAGSSEASEGSGSEAADSPGASASGATTTGVTGTTIKLGAHAPTTGAAPIPSDSATKGNDLYYEWLREIDEPINGRHVETMLKYDNYNPSQAVAVCKEMVEKDHVFLLYGFAGTDQIQACGRYAASVAVPYLSVGVTETGLETLPNYFAVSMTFREQGPLLTDLLTTKLGAKQEVNGMLWFDTPNFEDAHSSFIDTMDRAGAPIAYDRRISRGAGQTEAQTAVQEMKARGIENVYVLTSPVWFLQVLQSARTQEYEPQWVGVGITKALDSVASVGCRNGTINGAKFFSPFPAWAEIDRYDPDFKKAVRAVYPEKDQGDDIMLVGWGMAKVTAELLRAGGRDLTREGFIAAAERQKNIKTGVFPPVSFAPGDHLGGSAVHLNEAQCSGYKNGDNRWHTIAPTVSDF